MKLKRYFLCFAFELADEHIPSELQQNNFQYKCEVQAGLVVVDIAKSSPGFFTEGYKLCTF